jgi:acetoin utilization deacetylase AcuC-like enzyme
MKAIFDERQLRHDPARYFRRGAFMDHPEQPARAELLRDMLLRNGFPVESPRDHGIDPAKAVHDPDYVDFFRDAHARFVADAGTEAMAVPTAHPGVRRGRCPVDIHGALGWWMTDTSTPLTAGTWDAIYWSAQTAMEAATRVAEGERAVYALSRPPGHHAMRACANGFCFLNNAAIAADMLARRFGKVGLLDIDIHTGNGSLDIFYDRADVFFCSVHVDPARFPTFYLGHAAETGAGNGAGASLNLLLQPGDGEGRAIALVERGLAEIAASGARALVISLGFDMARDDPLSVLDVGAEGFAAMAERIAAAGLPTVLVQEGGYLGPSLSDNAQVFLTTFRRAAALTTP